MNCKHKYTVIRILFPEQRVKIKCIRCGLTRIVDPEQLGKYEMFPPLPKHLRPEK